MFSMCENTCVDMAAFDEEIKSLSTALFPAPHSTGSRAIPSGQESLFDEVVSLQRLDAKQRDQRLQEMDPLINRLHHDIDAVQTFVAKYKSLL
jgi:hypothetical protein